MKIIQRSILILIAISFILSSSYAQTDSLTQKYYRECYTVFFEFVDAAKKIAENRTEGYRPLDTTELAILFQNHVTAFDVNRELPQEEAMNHLKKNAHEFISLLNDSTKFAIRPINEKADTYVYNRLNPFSRSMTFVVTDWKKPDQPLYYFLIMNGPLLNQPRPKIVAWKLVYFHGQFFYQNLLDQIGTEAFFNIHHE